MCISVAAVPSHDVRRPLSSAGYQADAPVPQSLACITQPWADSVLLQTCSQVLPVFAHMLVAVPLSDLPLVSSYLHQISSINVSIMFRPRQSPWLRVMRSRSTFSMQSSLTLN